MEGDISYDRRKEWARMLYTKQDMAIGDIALMVGADAMIVRSWIKEGRWNEVKRSLLVSKEAQLERLYQGIELICEEAKARGKENGSGSLTIKEITEINKYTSAINDLESETSVRYIVQVAELFTTWLLRRDTLLAQQVTHQFEAFILEQDITRPRPIR